MVYYLLNHMVLFFCLCIVTLGLSFTWRANVFSLGQHGFWCIGAYFVVFITRITGESFLGQIAVGGRIVFFIISILGAGLIAGLISFLFIHFLKNLRDDYFAIASLAFAEMVRILLTNFSYLGGALGAEIPYFLIKPTNASNRLLFMIIFSIAAMIFLALIIIFIVRFNRDVRSIQFAAVREDEVAARHLGIDADKVRAETFTFSGIAAGISGAIAVHFTTFVVPDDFTFVKSIPILLFVIIGRYRVFSTLLWSFVIYSLYELIKLRFFGSLPVEVGEFIREWQESFYGIILVLAIIFTSLKIKKGKFFNFNKLYKGNKNAYNK